LKIFGFFSFFSFQIWDIGGQTIGSKMISKYIFGAQAVILAYDITKFETFQNLEDWLQIVKTTCANGTMPLLALVGNKNDLAHLRAVKLDKHTAFSDANKMHSYFVSAKSGDAVNTCFTRLAAELANVPLSKADLEATGKVVEAQLVNHQQNDPTQKPVKLKEEESSCNVQ
jgi:Ras-related protein Rab-28